MILRFINSYGTTIFEMKNPTELDIPSPNSEITVKGERFICYSHERIYDYREFCGGYGIEKEPLVYFDITVLTPKEYKEIIAEDN